MTAVEQEVPVGVVTPLRRLLLQPAVMAVACAGIVMRAWILLSPLGALNADEAYTGLQAMAITRGDVAIVIGGAAYTGTLDTFLLAPVVWIFGQHVVLLKLMSPVLWAVAAILAIGAARRVLGERWALLAGALVWLTPGALAVVSTRSYVAYALGLCLVLGAWWFAFVVIDQPQPPAWTAAKFGAIAGLGFYTHPMFAAVLAPMTVVVLLRHRARIRAFWVPAIVGALVVNAPFLLWNAKNSWPSLQQPSTPQSTYMGRLRGFFVGLLPRDLGVRRTDGAWTFGRPFAMLVVGAVLALSVFGAYRLLRVSRWHGAVLAAPLVFVWPLMAGLKNLSFVDDGRYGIVAFPVLAVAVTSGVKHLLDSRFESSWPLVASAWMLVCAVPFVNAEAKRDLGDPNRQTQHLIDAIEGAGFDRVAGYYWAVLPIEYQSDARIRVAVAGNPYTVRLPDTQRLVDATPPDRLAYVFLPGPIDPTWVKLPLERYRTVDVAGYTLYFPVP